jgi:hypothetical protein
MTDVTLGHICLRTKRNGSWTLTPFFTPSVQLRATRKQSSIKTLGSPAWTPNNCVWLAP